MCEPALCKILRSACMPILRSVKYYAAPPTLRLHKGLGSYAKNAVSLTPERVQHCLCPSMMTKSFYLGAFTTE
jgi:hypothetical protein